MSRQRKILQIATAVDQENLNIYALCEEGRIWCKMFNSAEHPWQEIDPLPPIEDATPAMESVRLNELVGRLGWIAAQLSDIGWGDDSASVAQASDLIRRQVPVEAPGDFEIGEWIESLPSWPDGWLATPLSELVCLVSAAFDRWPLSIPTDHEPPAPAAASPATMGASAARPDAPLTEVSPP